MGARALEELLSGDKTRTHKELWGILKFLWQLDDTYVMKKLSYEQALELVPLFEELITELTGALETTVYVDSE